MATSFFERFYARPADFPALPGATAINFPVMRAAIAAATPTAPLIDLLPTLQGARAVWEDQPPALELAAADAAVAAHTGFATTSLLQSFNSAAETQNSATSFIDKGADFVSTPLDAGRWGLRFAAQLRTTAVVVNAGARAILRAGFGGSLSGADDRAYTDHSIFSATQPQLWAYFDVFTVTAGQVLRFNPRLARSGAAATAAMLEFHADLFRIGD